MRARSHLLRLARQRRFRWQQRCASNDVRPLQGLTLMSGSSCRPHPHKANKKGEDAFFVAGCGRAVGVADGVGGWAELGVDSGRYSRELMQNASVFFETSGAQDPKEALVAAYASTTSIGTCTACIVAVSGTSLHAANLGDSGFMLLRKAPKLDDSGGGSGVWQMVYQTVEQQHYFNCPLQLGTNSKDRPEDAQTLSVPVRSGDMVVVATDGFFDNLFVNDVCAILNSSDFGVQSCELKDGPESEKMNDLADKLTKSALEAGLSTTRRSPFATAAMRAGFRQIRRR